MPGEKTNCPSRELRIRKNEANLDWGVASCATVAAILRNEAKLGGSGGGRSGRADIVFLDPPSPLEREYVRHGRRLGEWGFGRNCPTFGAVRDPGELCDVISIRTQFRVKTFGL